MRVRLVFIPRLRGWCGIAHYRSMRALHIFPAPFFGVAISYGRPR